ncbi:hypothetical protein OFR22_07055 [Brachyspira hyodysenteriae]|uniref:Lipoprotein n=1 Tax=Brachyspira hyodysenteriae ATCC 27164 TaxID=1266923 RepID=A0A3B6W5B1_BRAHO|nr:hypothetical protein [Brachyspira hyodysenteriae]ANN63814.1 hypothetical protein BHYOB78_08025 [Brachyspira hyodysenteriae ATCC 27164]AUJ49810.1 hypothetical protein BH718_01369 [Brachyspira hyodysenteriae]KLI19404.1 hypothetical protein SU44_00140 [Brachyspira hyodysenteriae]KLI20597.1 hypothetical protein SU43_12035 [Brachyspira hyodysenteriae]KLI22152.1 hypothetical protein SU46_00095 [Brachyspira hyodysenteriae]
MFKKLFIVVGLMSVLAGCETMQPKNNDTIVKNDNSSNEDKKEETITREDTPKMKVTVYGADKEIQAVEINDKTYYVIGGKDVENMTEADIKKSSLVAPLKVTEETINGTRGIVVTYYDVKVFLGKRTGTGTIVGIFEPQKNDWTTGNDLDRSLSIQIKLSRNIAGPIDIKRGSISLAFN